MNSYRQDRVLGALTQPRSPTLLLDRQTARTAQYYRLPSYLESSMLPASRRAFLRDLGIGAAAMPFVLNLPSLGFANQERRKQRLVVMFSPNGVVPPTFWPDEQGKDFTLKESLQPLEPFKDRTLIL